MLYLAVLKKPGDRVKPHKSDKAPSKTSSAGPISLNSHHHPNQIQFRITGDSGNILVLFENINLSLFQQMLIYS